MPLPCFEVCSHKNGKVWLILIFLKDSRISTCFLKSYRRKPQRCEAEFAIGSWSSLNICHLVRLGEVLDKVQSFWKIQIRHSITRLFCAALVTRLLQQFQNQCWSIFLDRLLHRVKGESSHQCHLSLFMSTQILNDPGLIRVVALNVYKGAKVTTTIQHGVVARLDVGLTPLWHKQGLVERWQAADHATQLFLVIRSSAWCSVASKDLEPFPNNDRSIQVTSMLKSLRIEKW